MKKRTDKPAKQPMNWWQRALYAIGAVGLVWFLLPMFAGIVNPANLAAVFGLGVFLWVLRHRQRAARLLRRAWKPVWGRVLLLASGVGLGCLVIVLAVLSILVTTKLGARPETASPTLIVLGCQVRGQTPSLLLYHRIQAAGDYLIANPDAVVVLSGGQGPGEEISEAACMYRALTERGVDPARLYVEDQSHVTRENLDFSAALMAREGLKGPVTIVSNDFHIYRALLMARDQGLDAQGLAARSDWYSKPTFILREAMALVKYWLTR